MRIVTRPDFDGIVCAVLLYEALQIDEPVKWVEPNDLQKGRVNIHNQDVIANLPYDENCALWFDHHYTNRINTSFKGAFKIAPLIISTFFAQEESETGQLSIKLKSPGYIFINSEFITNQSIENLTLKTGEYKISIFSLESRKWNERGYEKEKYENEKHELNCIANGPVQYAEFVGERLASVSRTSQ